MENILMALENLLGNDTDTWETTEGSQALNPQAFFCPITETDLDEGFDAIQSQAKEVDRLRAIPLFRLVCLGE